MNKRIIFKNYVSLSEKEQEELLKIRNEESIRLNSLNSEVIDLQSHLSWIKSLKNDENKKYYAIILNDIILGGINIYDIQKSMKWGIFFDADTSLLIKSFVPIYFIDYIFKNFKIKYLYSEIKNENNNAFAYNKNLGFEIEKREEEYTLLKTNKENFYKAKEARILKPIIKRMKTYIFELRN